MGCITGLPLYLKAVQIGISIVLCFVLSNWKILTVFFHVQWNTINFVQKTLWISFLVWINWIKKIWRCFAKWSRTKKNDKSFAYDSRWCLARVRCSFEEEATTTIIIAIQRRWWQCHRVSCASYNVHMLNDWIAHIMRLNCASICKMLRAHRPFLCCHLFQFF